MMKSFLIFAVLLFSIPSFAYEGGIYGGFQSTDVTVSSGTTNSGSGIRLGFLGFAEINTEFFIRSGAIYSQRKFSVGTVDVDLSYLDVPVTGLYMFSDWVGVFGGLDLGLKMTDSCTPTGCNVDAESLIYGLSVGGHFRFTPNIGMEVNYFLGFGDIAKNVESPKGVAVGAFFLF